MRYLVGLLLAATVSAAEKPEGIPISYDTRRVWIELPGATDPDRPHAPATHNAVPYYQALHPESGEVIGPSQPEFECDPADLRRYFRLEKQTFLLNEPILVEYRAELHGAGHWVETTDGNGRARGRNDNFWFLLLREDGTWVEDAQPRSMGPGGGWSFTKRVARSKPYAEWQAVQRWCAITEPGRYELFCFYSPDRFTFTSPQADVARALLPPRILASHAVDDSGRLIDKSTGERSTQYRIDWQTSARKGAENPLLNEMPQAVHALLDSEAKNAGYAKRSNLLVARRLHFERQSAISSANVYARFSIEIREGTKQETTAMVEQWSALTGPDMLSDQGKTFPRTVFAAITYVQSETFLPAIAQWVRADKNLLHDQGLSRSLLRMESPLATSLLLEEPGGLRRYLGANPPTSGRIIPIDHRPPHIANLIQLLGDTETEKRLRALEMLRQVGGGWYIGDAEAPEPSPTPAQYLRAREHWRGWLAGQPASIRSYARGIWGFIDRNGEFAIEPRFTDAEPFLGGIAEVADGANSMLIDAQGAPVDGHQPREGEGPYPFEDNGQWGYRNAAGGVAITPRYKYAYPFWRGRALVNQDGDLVVIDPAGSVVFSAERKVREVFPDGSMRFSREQPEGMRYGLLDYDGKEILPPEYDSVAPFSDGLALVRLTLESGKERYGYANPSGELVIEPQYANALAFSEGLAPVFDDSSSPAKWGYIDTNGDWAIAPQFRRAGVFVDGRAHAVLYTKAYDEESHGYIDHSGAWVIEPRFPHARSFSEGLAAVKVNSPYRWLGGGAGPSATE